MLHIWILCRHFIQEELDMEAELGELLRQIPEKRKMRMHADDEADLIQR